jgi:hypothetical protein
MNHRWPPDGAAGDNRYGPDPKTPEPHPAPRPGADHDDKVQRPDIQQPPRPGPRWLRPHMAQESRGAVHDRAPLNHSL